MYSRSVKTNFQNENEFRVPSNYRGNAFSFDRPKYEPPVMRESDVVFEEKAEAPKEICEVKKEETVPNVCNTDKIEKKSEHQIFGFCAEDMLLIALMLMLSGNGAEDDIILMLALLLAYKR